MMDRSWEIRELKGGYIVATRKPIPPVPGNDSLLGSTAYEEQVFSDSAALLNFLHNELMRSN